MKPCSLIMVAAAVCSLQTALCGEVERPQPVFNRAPLVETPYAQLAIGDIRPEGWLRVQMQTMLDGMTGHLDEIYAKVVGDNNAWLGGEGDAWERGPYWIDGALPMAYIMGDEALKAKCVKWVEAILASQKENGYFGPDTDRPSMDGMQRDNAADWWPRMVALKILQQYYMATGDGRVIDFMTRYFRYQAETLPSKPLGHWTFWGAERGGDNLLVVYWLYDITGDESLLDLGDLIHAQSCDWTGRFTKDNHLYRQNSLHCVNLAQGFKEPVIYYQRSKSGEHLNAPIEALRRIRYTIGFPTGLWAGDELIHFGEPTRGSELCTAVEMMYSLEEMCRVTGDNRYADLLERVAYNALPTQVSPEGDARQYFQQVNQTAVTRDMRNFSTTHEDTDLVFGTLTGYPCCTCNLHQGWPKLTQNLWYANAAGGLAALVYAPCTVETALASGRRVCIEEQTCYPFEETVRFKVSLPEKRRQAEIFPLDMRIPEWSDGYTLMVNGERVEPETVGDRTIRLTRAWADGDEAVLEFNAPVRVSYWYDNAAVIERGPLIYSLRMEEQWRKRECEGEDAARYGEYYYEVTSPTAWNVALRNDDLTGDNPKERFTVERRACGPRPWSPQDAPIVIRGRGVRFPSWHQVRGSAANVNYLSQIYPEEEVAEEVAIELVPYGCTTLRITEFPVR